MFGALSHGMGSACNHERQRQLGHQWSKFWWGDSGRTTRLCRGCSLGARGLWIEILAVCATPPKDRDIFFINGMPPTVQEMADMFGKNETE